LNDAGQNEEALLHAQQSLEIRRRLAEKNPDRFEPDYATSLSNYASHLSDVGQNEEALDHGRQALEIRRRLAEKNPDRFEPGYATSLSNYASHLSDVGQNEEALSYAAQALEIRRRLVEKNSRRFADDLFSTICFTHFLAWLCNQDKSVDQPELDKLMTFIPSHGRPLMLLFAAFVEGCGATDRAARNDAFGRVLSNWGDLSMGSKTRGEPYCLCASAWCATFEPAGLVESDWVERWRQFARQRSNHVPQWMLEVARRLEFEWPV
jgi:tetratricopeptide (TPR) repeat protein